MGGQPVGAKPKGKMEANKDRLGVGQTGSADLLERWNLNGFLFADTQAHFQSTW